jgi:hypothetical protein
MVRQSSKEIDSQHSWVWLPLEAELSEVNLRLAITDKCNLRGHKYGDQSCMPAERLRSFANTSTLCESGFELVIY